jgi:hypothetical protein
MWFVVNGKLVAPRPAAACPCQAGRGVRLGPGRSAASTACVKRAAWPTPPKDDQRRRGDGVRCSMGQVEGTPYAEYAKKVKISTKGPDLRATFQFTAAQLEKMAEQAQSLAF